MAIIKRVVFLKQIKNRKNSYCLDISCYGGRGNVQTYQCDHEIDQYYYIHSRGEVISHGKLQNQNSGHYLDVKGYEGHGNVAIWECHDEEDQVFTLYENGELVNADSGLCADIG